VVHGGPWKTPGKIHKFSLDRNPLPLAGSNCSLYFFQDISIVRDKRNGRDGWKVSTQKYTYKIESSGREIIAFQWERDGSDKAPYPHIHCGLLQHPESPIGRKVHIPSGRLAFEDVAYFLISELKVRHHQENWETILRENRQRFLRHRTVE